MVSITVSWSSTSQPMRHLSNVRHGCEVPKDTMPPTRYSTPGATLMNACWSITAVTLQALTSSPFAGTTPAL